MNFLFITRHKYRVNDSIENIRAEIESITNRRWHDFSSNITGRFKLDNSFILTHKWSFTIIKWLETDPAYLTGSLTREDDKVLITTSLRPNSLFVILFYLLAILFLFELVGIKTFEGSNYYKLLLFLLLALVLFALIRMYTAGLRRRFEKLLQLQQSE